MKNKKILILTLCSIITAMLVVAMVVLLWGGYFEKDDERLEVTSVSVYRESTNNSVFRTAITINNNSEQTIYLTDSYVRITIKDGSGKIVDCYTNKITGYISNNSFERFYVSSGKMIDFNENENYTAEVRFVDPTLYSVGYALIPFIIIGVYGIVASAISFRHSKQTNIIKDECNHSFDINNQEHQSKENNIQK